MSLILIVDDVSAVCEQYAYDLNRLGDYDVLAATGGKAALRTLETEPVDCVILDLEMPGMDGFEVLETIRARGWDLPVIVYTGTGSFERCVRAVKLGAFGFVDKAEPMEKVAREIENALEQSRLNREVSALRKRLGEDSSILGESAAVRRLHQAIAKLAPIPATVLILGESGTGKELVARELHRQGTRPRGPFTALNCAAIPENLVESELFGHEAGAFTGADRVRKGAFEMASGGTLFLDEIGDLPLPAQAKFLRVLEDGQVTRVGGTRTIASDARVVAATHRDLEQEIVADRFREDLLYRINAHVIAVPPLRERLDDVSLLAAYFLERTCEKFGARPKTLSAAAAKRLARHSWRRNNVRELRNIVERMVIAAEGDEIGVDHVPAGIGDGTDAGPASGGAASGEGAARSAPAAGAPAVGDSGSEASKTFKARKADAERAILLEALERNRWHISNTAAELGLADHSSLLKVMRRHGLKRG